MHRCRPLPLLSAALLMAGESGLANPQPEKFQAAVTALEQAWKADPGTSGMAFPPITAVATASRPQQLCPQAGQRSAPQALALYCRDQGRILIDRQRLEALATQYGSWDAAVWLATALGQAITAASGQPSGQQGALASNLQAYCFGGTLLGQAPDLRPPADRNPLATAFTAFPSRLDRQQGTPAQRSYALLTGIGGTSSDCGATAMANLAAGVVPDPERLLALASNPDRSTSARAFDTLIKAICLPKPPLGCPRLPPPEARVRSKR